MDRNNSDEQRRELTADFHEYSVRERIVRLESEMRQLRTDIRELRSDVKEVRDVVVQVRGARWLLVVLSGIAATIGAFLTKFFPSWRP